MPISLRIGLGLGLALLAGGAGAASNAAGALPVHLELDAPSACPGTQELARRTVRRSPRIRFVPGSAAAPTARVEIAPRRDGAFTATLTLVQPSGRRSWRQVETRTCDDAIEAVALVLALSLDPTAAAAAGSGSGAGATAPPAGTPPAGEPATRSGPAPAPPTTTTTTTTGPAPATTAPSPPAPATPPPSAPAATPTPTPAPAPPPAVEEPPTAAITASPAAPIEPARRSAAVGLTGEGMWGAAPGFLPGLAVYATLAWDRTALWSPAVRVAAGRLWSGGFEATGGRADFALDLLSLAFCPTALGRGRLVARGCAGGAAGRLTASGSETLAPESHARPWVALGASAIVAFEAGAGIEVAAVFEVSAPLIRDSFQFEPAVFHRVAAVASSVGIGVGARFK